MKRKLLSVVISVLFINTVHAIPHQRSVITKNVNVRPGVHLAIESLIITNPDAPANGKTVLCIHGLAHTASAFEGLAASLDSDPAANAKVRRMILLNLPGRGESGLPKGPADLDYGQMNLEDYASVVVEMLDEYKDRCMTPSEIVAHSMGGLVVQLTEKKLESCGSTLYTKYGVTNIALLSPSGPAEVPDAFLDSGAGIGLLDAYSRTNDNRGVFVTVDPMTFLGLFFSDTLGNVVPNAPTPQQIRNQELIAKESYAAGLQTVGTSDLRPSVPAGIFAPAKHMGVRVLVGTQDIFGGSVADVYYYLTGDATFSKLIVIDSPTAVHDQFITEPQVVLPLLGL